MFALNTFLFVYPPLICPVLYAIDWKGIPGYSDGSALQAAFTFPTSLAFDSEHNNLYVGDSYKQNSDGLKKSFSAIRRISLDSSNVSTIVGSACSIDMDTCYLDGASESARLSGVSALLWDNNGHTLYFSDFYNHRVRTVSCSHLGTF